MHFNPLTETVKGIAHIHYLSIETYPWFRTQLRIFSSLLIATAKLVRSHSIEILFQTTLLSLAKRSAGTLPILGRPQVNCKGEVPILKVLPYS